MGSEMCIRDSLRVSDVPLVFFRGAAGASSAPISNRILSPKALWEETLSCVSSNNRPRKGLSCCHRPRKKKKKKKKKSRTGIIIATVSAS